MQIISIVSCIKILKNVYNLTQVTTLAICLWINCLFLYYIWKYIYPISIEIHVTVSKFILHILRASSSSPVAVLASSFCTARRISYQSSRACFLLVNRVEVHYKSAWLTFSALRRSKHLTTTSLFFRLDTCELRVWRLRFVEPSSVGRLPPRAKRASFSSSCPSLCQKTFLYEKREWIAAFYTLRIQVSGNWHGTTLDSHWTF